MADFNFTWSHPANEVYVTGTFDHWSKSEKLEHVDDHFEKVVHLKDVSQKIYYKFVVDGNWVTDHTAPQEADEEGNVNNFLSTDQLTFNTQEASLTGLLAEGSGTSPDPSNMDSNEVTNPSSLNDTSAHKENKSFTNEDHTKIAIYTTEPSTKVSEASKESEPTEVSTEEVKALPTSAVSAYDRDEQSSTATTDDDISVAKNAAENAAAISNQPQHPIRNSEEERIDNSYSVNPLPASENATNPIQLSPRDPVPSFSASAIDAHVTLDKSNYEQADIIPGSFVFKTDMSNTGMSNSDEISSSDNSEMVNSQPQEVSSSSDVNAGKSDMGLAGDSDAQDSSDVGTATEAPNFMRKDRSLTETTERVHVLPLPATEGAVNPNDGNSLSQDLTTGALSDEVSYKNADNIPEDHKFSTEESKEFSEPAETRLRHDVQTSMLIDDTRTEDYTASETQPLADNTEETRVGGSGIAMTLDGATDFHTVSSVGPSATTVGLAGTVPLEKDSVNDSPNHQFEALSLKPPSETLVVSELNSHEHPSKDSLRGDTTLENEASVSTDIRPEVSESIEKALPDAPTANHISDSSSLAAVGAQERVASHSSVVDDSSQQSEVATTDHNNAKEDNVTEGELQPQARPSEETGVENNGLAKKKKNRLSALLDRILFRG